MWYYLNKQQILISATKILWSLLRLCYANPISLPLTLTMMFFNWGNIFALKKIKKSYCIWSKISANQRQNCQIFLCKTLLARMGKCFTQLLGEVLSMEMSESPRVFCPSISHACSRSCGRTQGPQALTSPYCHVKKKQQQEEGTAIMHLPPSTPWQWERSLLLLSAVIFSSICFQKLQVGIGHSPSPPTPPFSWPII